MSYALVTDKPELNQLDIYYLADAKRAASKAVRSGGSSKAEVLWKDTEGNITDLVYWCVWRDAFGVHRGGDVIGKRSIDIIVPALQGNQNASKGKHGSQVIRLSVEMVDNLYECLALEGEFITGTDPDRIRGFVFGILNGYVRQHIERVNNDAMIL